MVVGMEQGAGTEMSLPNFQSDQREFQMMQSQWSAQIDPVLNLPQVKGLLLKDIVLSNGITIINHRLDRKQQGWIVTDINGAATIYRSQLFNEKTLTLTSDAAVTVSLWVY